MQEFFRKIRCDDDNRYADIIEDDGKVAYAYLLYEQNVIGDVWLYNNNETPADAPWTEGKNMPFANPMMYLNLDKQILPLEEGVTFRLNGAT